MKSVLLVVAALVALGVPARALAGPKEDVAAATQAWAEAFNSRDPARVVAFYDPEAVFWGTASPIIRDTPELVRDYFKNLPNQPQGGVELGEQHVRVYGDIALNTGTYTFINVRDGQRTRSPARFSFTYRRKDGRWLIIDHHSSAVPSAPAR